MKTLQQHINERLILNKDRVQKAEKKKYIYFPKNKAELIEIIDERDYLNVNEYDNAILDLNDIDTSDMINLSYLFERTKSTKIDINNWNLSNVTDIHGLFWNRSDIEEIYCDKLDVSNVKDFYGVFYGCAKLKKLNLDNWKFSHGDDFQMMFKYCINLDLSFTDNWKIPKNAQTSHMFDECKYVPSWYKI